MREDANALDSGWSGDAASFHAAAHEPVPDDWPLQQSSRLVEAAGARWHVQQSGAGPRLLLLHGTAASTHTWRTLLPLLATRFEVLAIDLPGHGYTERLPDHSMSLPALSVAIAALLRRLDVQPDGVIGHSAGAAIALRMSLDGMINPACIVGLNAALLPFGGMLQRIFAPMAQLFATTRLMPRLVANRARDSNAVRRILEGTGSKLDDAGVRLYQRLLQRESHVAAVLAMMASWDLQPLLSDLPRLVPRLHLVAGLDDKAVSPREADRIAAALPGTSVTRLRGCGHLAHEERAEAVADVVMKFCKFDRQDGDARD